MTNGTIELPICVEEPNLLPKYESTDASGADVRANISKTIEPGESALIPTGLRFAVPKGYEIQVRPRSGLALKHQIAVLNSPGTLDADYRGELHVILINHGKNSFEVTSGMRIAQIVLAPVFQANFNVKESLSETERGENGFGHTGVH